VLKALMKSMRLIVVLLLSLVLAKRVFADSPFLPEPLEKCLKPSSLQVQVTLVLTRNPFYLRGDFDADGRPDYAVVVRVKETGKEALVICRSAGRAVLLGGRADAKQAFSSNEGDDFVAKNWEVLTAAEVRKLTSFASNVPRPLPNQVGDAIAMIFEDAVELVYWDGRQFRHAPAHF